MKLLRCLNAVAFLLGVLATAGQATPFFTQDPRTLPQDKWRVETHFLFSDFDESLSDGDRVPLLAGNGASSFSFETRVRYGASDNLTLFVDVPYVAKELEVEDGSTSSNSGFGDLFFLAKYKFHDSRAAKTRAAVALATKLDTGEYRDLLPELALGTGQTNSQIVLLVEKETGPNTLYASGAYVWTGERSDTKTDPGNVTALNAAIEHRLRASAFNLVGEINWVHQGRFERDDAIVEESGSTRLDVAAGLQYAPKPKAGRKLVVETELRVPIRESGFARAVPDYVYYLGAWMVF